MTTRRRQTSRLSQRRRSDRGAKLNNGRETDHDGDVYRRKYTKHGTCGIWETHGRVRERNASQLELAAKPAVRSHQKHAQFYEQYITYIISSAVWCRARRAYIAIYCILILNILVLYIMISQRYRYDIYSFSLLIRIYMIYDILILYQSTSSH